MTSLFRSAVVALAVPLIVGTTPLPIAALSEQADAIVVGTVLSGTEFPAGAAFRLRVERTIKGSARVGETLSLTWKSRIPLKVQEQPIAASHGLFFLKVGSGGTVVLPVYPGSPPFLGAYYPLAVDQPIEWSPDHAALERVVAELSASVAACRSPQLDPHAGYGLATLEDPSLLKRASARMMNASCNDAKMLALTLSLKAGERDVCSVVDQAQRVSKTAYVIVLRDVLKSIRAEGPWQAGCVSRALSAIQ